MTTRRYHVSEITCEGCKRSIEGALAFIPSIDTVEVDLEAKLVVVTGEAADEAIVSAITAAGFEVAGAHV